MSFILRAGDLGRREPQDITTDDPTVTVSLASLGPVPTTPGAIIVTDTVTVVNPTISVSPHSKEVPEIGGSEGGFIGLVVGLSLIIAISCAGVFYLLATRPHGGQRHGRVPGVGGLRSLTRNKHKAAEEGYNPETQEAGFPSRKGTLFGFRSRGRDGWIQASAGDDGDEWDSELEMDMPVDQRQHASGSRDQTTRPGYQSPLEGTTERRYDDPYDDSPLSPPSLRAGHQDLNPTQKIHAEHPRQVSVDSAETTTSQHSFSGGSKFLEAL